MKTVKHFFKYLTCSTYRLWTDFCTQEENVNKNMDILRDRLALMTYPMFRVDEKGEINKLK